jgi:hypothetical protein
MGGGLYSITHVPAAEQGKLLGRIGSRLKPGGVFVGSFGTGAARDWIEEWLGAEMFFGHAGEATSVALVRQAGLERLPMATLKQDNEDACARKLDSPTS